MNPHQYSENYFLGPNGKRYAAFTVKSAEFVLSGLEGPLFSTRASADRKARHVPGQTDADFLRSIGIAP